MGIMADIGMPVELTIAGRAYDDTAAVAGRGVREQPALDAPHHLAPRRCDPHPDHSRPYDPSMTTASGHLMPAESAPQQRVWMAFPSGLLTRGHRGGPARRQVHLGGRRPCVAEFEPVTMVVDPAERDAADRYLSASIERLEAPLQRRLDARYRADSSMRPDGSVAAVDWVFNGWGAQSWARWDRDARIGRIVADAAGTRSSAPISSTGWWHPGGRCGHRAAHRHRATRPGRNPGRSRAEVEAELARTIGTTHAVWLPRG